MIWTLIVITVSLLIVLLELPSLVKQQQWRELGVFFCVLAFACGIGIAEGLSVKLPNPLDAIMYLYAPISRMIEALFR